MDSWKILILKKKIFQLFLKVKYIFLAQNVCLIVWTCLLKTMGKYIVYAFPAACHQRVIEISSFLETNCHLIVLLHCSSLILQAFLFGPSI